ncbi:MAG: SpoIVB peptidase [Oscillospiraceae bacterium]|nr:SpoIVB peptidase [Oscillospiraceae bacterium]
MNNGYCDNDRGNPRENPKESLREKPKETNCAGKCGNRTKKSIGVFLAALALIVNYSTPVKALRELPDDLTIHVGEERVLDLGLPMGVSVDGGGALSVASSQDQTLEQAKSLRMSAQEEGNATVSLTWLGLPLKSMNVQVSAERKLIPGGQSIGVALATKGVLVVGTSEISGAQSGSPAYSAGLRPGDVIQQVNNTPIENTAQLTQLVNSSNGGPINVLFLRKEQLMKAVVTPAKDRLDGQYRLGIWVRDSTAGIGTLSFYDPESHTYAALGHAITDVDTGTNLTVREGRVLFSEILDIVKGQKGTPGELRGSFMGEQVIFGNITKNTDYGVYGQSDLSITNSLYPNGLPIASKSSVHTGPATILTTLDDTGVHEYAIEITHVNQQATAGQKSMTLRVTDPVLLEKTGGIVQGMSGSPIIQDGRIIGAVTHVYVNDPTQGYGLFIEWMLAQADN